MKPLDLRVGMRVGIGAKPQTIDWYCKVVETHSKEIKLWVINGAWFMHMLPDGSISCSGKWLTPATMNQGVHINFVGPIPDSISGEYQEAMWYMQDQLDLFPPIRWFHDAVLNLTMLRKRWGRASKAAYRAFYREMGWQYQATKQEQWDDRVIHDDVPF